MPGQARSRAAPPGANGAITVNSETVPRRTPVRPALSIRDRDPSGGPGARFRYRFQHAERMISLGVYPGVNLATARLLHADARGLLARDIDPSADRKEKCAASAHTFEVVARQWLKLLQPRVANGQLAADTVEDATRILERDIFPALGTAQSGVHFTEDSQPHYTRHTFARRCHRGKRS